MLRIFYLVSDLNWNAAINDLREVEREDLGIVISSRTAAIRPWKRGRGGRGANRETVLVATGGGAAARGRGGNTNT